MRIVDGHVHVFDTADRVARDVDALVPAQRSATSADLVERLHTTGVDGAVLVPLDPHDEPVRSALQAMPEAVAAVAVASEAEQGRAAVDPVTAVRRRHEDFPFRALRTMWLGEPGRTLRDSPMWPVLQWLATEDIALWSYLPPDQAPHLAELGRLLPDLAVVLNHLGFAPHEMRVDDHARPRFDSGLPAGEVDRVHALAGHPRFHLMFSGHYALSAFDRPYRDLHDAGQRLVDAFSPARTLWASDWPWIDTVPGYPEVLASVDTALPGLSATERADILGGTVTRLLT